MFTQTHESDLCTREKGGQKDKNDKNKSQIWIHGCKERDKKRKSSHGTIFQYVKMIL